jgi:hypothetical protein
VTERSTGRESSAAEPAPALDAPLLGLDDILGPEHDDCDLLAGDLPATDPAERRTATLWFGAAAGVLCGLVLVLAVIPGFRKRAILMDRFHSSMQEMREMRGQLAELRAYERRLRDGDPYLLERLGEDRLRRLRAGMRPLLPERATPDPERGRRPR